MKHFETLVDLIVNETSKSKYRSSLKKMFLLECKVNQKLLAIASWQNVDSAKALYAFSDKTLLGELMDKLNFKIKNESKNELKTDSNKIISLITRIEALRFLGNLPDNLEKESKAKYNVRISNLNRVMLEVTDILDKELTNS